MQPSSHQKPLASLSIDLDNAWAYLRAAGKDDWQTTPSYFARVIPHIVATLRECELPLTVFLVGRDLESSSEITAIRQFQQLSAVEWANHSYEHEPWMHLGDEAAVEREVARTETLIEQHFGERPVGFRGPGFSLSETLRQILARRDYLYDASVFPTSMAPLARLYFLMKTGRSNDPRLKDLYGGWRSVLKSNRPVRCKIQQSVIWQLPVTVMPLIRTPIHFSYLMFLAQIQPTLAMVYWRTALFLLRTANCQPSLLLHPPDFLGGDEEPRLAHMPGMRLQGEAKRKMLKGFLKLYSEQFSVVTMREHARRCESKVAFSDPIASVQVEARS